LGGEQHRRARDERAKVPKREVFPSRFMNLTCSINRNIAVQRGRKRRDENRGLWVREYRDHKKRGGFRLKTEGGRKFNEKKEIPSKGCYVRSVRSRVRGPKEGVRTNRGAEGAERPVQKNRTPKKQLS